jgi:hypothetical protein
MEVGYRLLRQYRTASQTLCDADRRPIKSPVYCVEARYAVIYQAIADRMWRFDRTERYATFCASIVEAERLTAIFAASKHNDLQCRFLSQ